MKTLIESKAKALAGAVITAIVGYAALALQQGTALTLHGLEAAAAGAVVGFLGVHQAPKNKQRHKTAADAGMTIVEAVVAIIGLLVIVWLVVFLVHHTH